MKSIHIPGHEIGGNAPCFIIAEAGVNHNGDIALARKLIEVAHDCGADAVKFQTFRVEKVVTRDAPKADYQKSTTDSAESFWDMGRKIELSYEAFRELKQYCDELGILFLSTPFDAQSADFLNDLGMPLFKIPSGELTNFPLLSHIGAMGKPGVLSTGMSDLDEVRTAVDRLNAVGMEELILLQCTTNYPAAPEDANLRAMQTMSEAFQLPVGISDHVVANEVSFAAVAMGACIVEKHFTLDRDMEGPDHKASLNPDGLRHLVSGIRLIESAFGSGVKAPSQNEIDMKPIARRSLFASRELPAGTVISEADVDILRPGNFLQPEVLPEILGRRLNVSMQQGAPFSFDDLSSE
jgi:N-acetylneuraminate synthase